VYYAQSLALVTNWIRACVSTAIRFWLVVPHASEALTSGHRLHDSTFPITDVTTPVVNAKLNDVRCDLQLCSDRALFKNLHIQHPIDRRHLSIVPVVLGTIFRIKRSDLRSRNMRKMDCIRLDLSNFIT